MTESNLFFSRTPTWCPGCGNFGIWGSLKNAIKNLGWDYGMYAIVYGVGCSGNMTDFVSGHGFHSLHGRALPNAEGIKLANHTLNVICEVGDGDCYGEGGNHLLHAMRGNSDIKVFVHDNRVYGLTTGQTAPTSLKGFKSKTTPQGVIEYPVNPLALALTQGASFIAQGFAGDVAYLTKLVTEALLHKGFALLNILQPCVTFNKINTYEFYRTKVYKLEDEGYFPDNKEEALKRITNQTEKIPVGIIYKEERPTYQDQETVLAKGPLARQGIEPATRCSDLLADFTEIQNK
jgi:2-oxoglutarate/2-oxoacid ferredoxin oxidoreductase subunit beta